MDGASDEVLRSASTPTGLTAPGLLQHLANVERWWLRHEFAGEVDLAFDGTEDDPRADLDVAAGTSTADLLARYAAEAGLCDAVVAAAPSLDTLSARGEHSLRWVLLHLVEETARHLGHLDLLREQADGAVGEEPEP